jgi:hypothetical protein
MLLLRKVAASEEGINIRRAHVMSNLPNAFNPRHQPSTGYHQHLTAIECAQPSQIPNAYPSMNPYAKYPKLLKEREQAADLVR